MNANLPFQEDLNNLVLESYHTKDTGIVDKILNFYHDHCKQDRDNYLKHQCLLLAGDVLERQGDLARALAMYQEVISGQSPLNDAYNVVVPKAVSALQKLNRQPEALALLEQALQLPRRDPLLSLHLMSLHIGMADPQAELPVSFGPLLHWITQELDVQQSAGPDLRTSIVNLAQQTKQEGKALTKLLATAGEVPPDENVKRFNAFITQAKVKLFREEANQYLVSLQA